MRIVDWLRQRLAGPGAGTARHRIASAKSESDSEADPHHAGNRDSGGVPDPDKADQASTTGPTPNAGHVGRVAGVDIGYHGETGAERRAGEQ